jgi:glycosyltransferase involved in cell wall biosynthesis
MLAVFTHCTMHRYGGYSGVGSVIRNLLAGFNEIGYPYIAVPDQLPSSIISRITNNRFLTEQRDVFRLNKMEKMESILFSNYFLPPFGVSGARSTVIVHDTLFADMPVSTDFMKRQWLNIAFGRLLKSATNIVFISNFARDRYLTHFGDAPNSKYWVIPNSINEQLFAFQPKRAHSEIPQVVTVSSYSPHKNYETFIRLAAHYKGRAKFVSIGKPPSPGRWKDLFRSAPDVEAKVEDVVYTGYVSEKQLIELMANSDIFLHPSRYEGFGMPPVEAIALGLPVVVSDIPPLRESLSGKAMFVSNPNDVSEWRHCLDRMIESPPSMEDRARWSAEVRKLYSRKNAARKFSEVIGST